MQTGRMPAAKLFQSLTSPSRNEAVIKIQTARLAEKQKKKKIKQNKKNHEKGRVEELLQPLFPQSL
jgi:hypothetical protein